jgi:hypothetical protein
MMRNFLALCLVTLMCIAVPLAAQGKAGDKTQEQSQQASQSWSGTLVDADCKAGDPGKPCEVAAATRSFGIVTDDGAYAKLDNQGNTLVAAELKGKRGKVKVKITGKLNGDLIQVESVQLS